jgi:hypothetical protein
MSWFADLFGEKFENKLSKLKADILCNEEEHKARVETCLKCEHYSKEMQMCKQCWCIVPLKTKVKGFHCPVNKW